MSTLRVRPEVPQPLAAVRRSPKLVSEKSLAVPAVRRPTRRCSWCPRTRAGGSHPSWCWSQGVGVATTLDQVGVAFDAFQVRSTLTLELEQDADRNVSVSWTVRPTMDSDWFAAGVGRLNPNVPNCWTAAFVLVWT